MSSIAVSLKKAQYDRIKDLADKAGLSIGETLDTMLNENWSRVPEALRLIERVNSTDGIELSKEDLLGHHSKDASPIEVVQENGHAYECSECGQDLDPLKKPEKCPSCDAELDWSKQAGSGWGWALAALAILAAIGGLRR